VRNRNLDRCVDNVTAAERIAERFRDDGQCWVDPGGVELETALLAAGATCATPGRLPRRWELPDGSAIVAAGGGWDIGVATTDDDDRRRCTCWADVVAHDDTQCCDSCRAARDALELDETEWHVCHGGSLYGLGRWSGPHASEAEARDSAREARLVVGGSPIVTAEQVTS